MAKRAVPVKKRLYTHSMAEELAYLCRHLEKEETQILAAALRRGVFETYKSFVVRQYAAGDITARQAADLLGEKVFGKVSQWLPQPGAPE